MNMIGEETVTLKEYIYGQVFDGVSAENRLYAVLFLPIRIRLSTEAYQEPVNFKDYKGFIIGIEKRQSADYKSRCGFNDKETGDLLWVIGTRAMADEIPCSAVFLRLTMTITKNFFSWRLR